jgi:hypothetical protein
MNTTFNFSRFLKVLSNEWRLNWKKMLLFWGGIIAISVAYFAYYIHSGMNLIDRSSVLMLSFFAAVLLQGFYLQFYFHEFSSKKKRQALFLLPASQNETFWAKFSLGAVLYLLISFLFILALLEISETVNTWIWNNGLSERHTLNSYTNHQNLTVLGDSRVIWILSYMWLFSVAGFLLGLLIFKKNAVLKSLIFWVIVIATLGYFISTIYFLLTGDFPTFAFIGIIWKDSGALTLYNMYPKLMFGSHIFIYLALITIARVKYNEKTI